jgi:[acyl-carrier-protein] S-malonyltransferase
MRALVFPGQGSQAVGMGKALAEASPTARELFQEVDDALSQSLSRLMWEGPAETLTLTQNAQPAIMAASMALVRVMERDAKIALVNVADLVAGHSLGEYTALCAAGSLEVAECAKLLRVRGEAMQAAVAPGAGAMAALLGLDLPDVQAVVAEAAQGGVCAAANDNAPGQVVISGDRAAVERAIELAKARGAKRAIMLDVSAPFHCALMQPAADAMATALATANLRAPVLPVVANVTTQPVADPALIRQLLVDQVTGMVRWRESIEAMVAAGTHSFVEIGAGRVLSGMIKRINRDVAVTAIESLDDIDAFLKAL